MTKVGLVETMAHHKPAAASMVKGMQMQTVLTTLLLIVKDNKILLGEKKRGWRQGVFNGFGGKVESGETFDEAMIRETIEEVDIIPTKWEKVAIHNFEVYLKGELTNLICHTYLATEFEGEAQESDEMRPQWFDLDKIPYGKMWTDDIYWLPCILRGEKLITYFEFDEDNNVLSHKLTSVINFDDSQYTE